MWATIACLPVLPFILMQLWRIVIIPKLLSIFNITSRGGVRLDAGAGNETDLSNVTLPRIKFLGHAGFVYQWMDVTVLIDPWFYPAFMYSWYPFPDNRFLAQDDVVNKTFDYLYISHSELFCFLCKSCFAMTVA